MKYHRFWVQALMVIAAGVFVAAALQGQSNVAARARRAEIARAATQPVTTEMENCSVTVTDLGPHNVLGIKIVSGTGEFMVVCMYKSPEGENVPDVKLVAFKPMMEFLSESSLDAFKRSKELNIVRIQVRTPTTLVETYRVKW